MKISIPFYEKVKSKVEEEKPDEMEMAEEIIKKSKKKKKETEEIIMF